ncbi:hypothetical protein Tco_0151823 [Tanacetum coccineum]
MSLLEKEKENLEIIESLKSKGSELSENAISDSENQSENDCHDVEKGCDNLENSNVLAPGMFQINVSQSVSPISAYKPSCASNNVENKTKRKRRTINLGLWYPKDSGFDLTAYSDADHAGCHLDRKSTSGSVQFLGDKLVCWSSKKQNCVSISTAESEYVAVSGCCAQVLWMRTQLTDYGFFFDKVPIYCDSKSAIAISCNPVQHTRTKHIDVRYHFIKDHVEKGTIELYFVGTEFQLADLFTKSLPEARFKFLVEKLGMMSRET